MEKAYQEFQKAIDNYAPKYRELIYKAYSFAEEYHRDQYRQNGDLYITHPLAVATILAEIKADADTICAGLLHDTLEDTSLTKGTIIKEFNPDIEKLVEGVTKISNTSFSSKKDADFANTRKIIISIIEDIRIIIIKLADRLHNMRTLQYKSVEKQQFIAKETLDVFVPLAEKIGAYQIKRELEDLSLMYLDPVAYKDINENLAEVEEKVMPSLQDMIIKINDLLSAKNIPHEIKIKVKHIYEIYLKKIINESSVDNIPNVFALNVIVDDYISCYETLGWIHSAFIPIDDMTRFYIPSPKDPLHRAIHTTVIGPSDKLIQVQIKTNEMDLLSNFGLTAFWQMSPEDVREKMQSTFKKEFQNYTSLEEINAMNIDDAEFVKIVQKEVFLPGITVYTQKGEPIRLPSGSTVIDFAYQIHSDLGDHLTSARINGVSQSIFYQLNMNDRVRILTDFDQISCDESWLENIQTIRAKKFIKEALNKKEKDRVLSLSD